MNPDKYIIGAGITGLVWKYYHPEFQIISPNIGGDYSRSHLVWLHDTVETRKLLTDLDMEIFPKLSMTGYFHTGWISDTIPRGMNQFLIQKKMTPWNEPVDTNFIPKTNDLSLASGELMMSNYMRTLDVDLEEVITKLNEHADVRHGFVTQITEGSIRVKQEREEEDANEQWVGYDTIISTVAAPLFWKMWGTPKNFKSLPITNILTSNRPSVFDDRYEMVYYDDTVPFSRVSHLGEKYALEFTGIITKEQFGELYPNLPVLDYFIVPQGRIFENEENLPPTGRIIFSGRFSQWNYRITSENSISQSINYNVSK